MYDIIDKGGNRVGKMSIELAPAQQAPSQSEIQPMYFPNPRVIVTGAGHGGWNPWKKKYATSPRDGKKFKHIGLGKHPDPDWFLEGVENRIIASKLERKLLAATIPFVRSYDVIDDLPLAHRVALVNEANVRADGRTLSIDIHTNAVGKLDETVQFWSVWTSRGQTQSDKYADFLFSKWDRSSLDMPTASQSWADGDHDYEAGFAMLKKTRGPAILTEAGFMTSRQSIEFITREDVREARAQMLFELCVWAQDN